MPSTVVKSFHYDNTTKNLRVVFTSGAVYDYKGVPDEIFLAMKTSASKGNYLNLNIKGKYPFKKVS
jgi:hypothetical protein